MATPRSFPAPMPVGSGGSSADLGRFVRERHTAGTPDAATNVQAFKAEVISRESLPDLSIVPSPQSARLQATSTKVRGLIDGVLDQPCSKHCQGLLYLVTASKYREALLLDAQLDLKDPAKQLKEKFEQLGFAVVWHDNPTALEVSAAIDYLSSGELRHSYPASYRYLGAYIACHGEDLGFKVSDDLVPFVTVTHLAKALGERFVYLFFFDCCREKNGRAPPVYPETDMERDTIILYAVPSGRASVGPGGGASYMMLHLIEQLDKDITLNEIFKGLRKRMNIHGIHERNQVYPAHETTSEKINLLQERNKIMIPVLSDVSVSMDRAYVTLVFQSPPSVNPRLFSEERHSVEMWWAGDWSHQPSDKPVASSADPLKLSIKAEIEPWLRSCDTDVKFRVVTKFMKPGLQLESNIIHCTLPASVRPEITDSAVYLRDGHHLQVSLRWGFPSTDLPISQCCVVLTRKSQLYEDLVNSTQFPFSPDTSQVALTLTGNDWNKYVSTDSYEVMIAMETKDGKRKIDSVSYCVKKVVVRPELPSLVYSPDGTMVTARVLSPDPTADPQDYQLQIKQSRGASDWLTLPSCHTAVARSRAISTGSGRYRADTGNTVHVGLEERTELPVKGSLFLPGCHRDQVIAYVRTEDNAKFRVVSAVEGKLRIPSAVLREIGRLPTPVPPVVRGTPTVHFPTAGDPLVSVRWQLSKNPSTPEATKYTVIVSTDSGTQYTSTEPILYQHGRNEYHHDFSIPDLPRERLRVCIRETRLDSNDAVMNSATVVLKRSTGCCYGKVSRKCLCGVPISAVVFLLCTLLSLAIGGCLGYCYYRTSHVTSQTVSSCASGNTSPIPLPHPLDPLENILLQPAQLTVATNRTTDTADLRLYCHLYDSTHLSNERSSSSFIGSPANEIVNRTTLLPLYYQVLSGSWFWVSMCLSADQMNPDPELYLQLYQPLGSEEYLAIAVERVLFGGRSCHNVTNITAAVDGGVFLGLTSPDIVKLENVIVGAHQFYYDPRLLDIAQGSNLISPGDSKVFPVEPHSQVVCYNSHGPEGTIYYGLFSITVALEFKPLPLGIFLGLLIGSSLAAILSVLCGCGWYHCGGTCPSCCHKTRRDYQLIIH